MATEKPELQEVATTLDGRDITRGYVSPLQLLQPTDTVLATRGGGDLRLYQELLRDDQVKATWQQRQLAVTSAEWEVLPGGQSRQDKAAADFMREQLEQIRFDRVTSGMLYGVFYGYAVAECLWGRDGRHVTLDALKVRNRRRFRFDGAGRLRLLTASTPEGELLPDRKFWTFSTGADHDDEPYGQGLGHWLYWPVFFKRNGLRLWLVFLDKFGQPTAKGTFPQSSTEAQKQRLLQALQAVHSDSGVIVPEGMQIELIEAARSGTGDYTSLYDRMDRAIAKVVLGHTGSSESAPGRLGGEDMASDVRDDIVKADADVVCESFNQSVARWLTEWNYPSAKAPRVWRKMEQPEDLNKLAERDERIARLGYRPTLKYVEQHYGEGFELDTRPAPQPSLGFAERDGASAKRRGDQMADRLEREAEPAWAELMEPVRRLVESAGSMEELRDGLLNLYEDMPSDQLAQVMQKAIAAAELAGRADVSEGE
jgi:phage gp29-like protein